MAPSNTTPSGRWDELFAVRKRFRYKPEDNKLLSSQLNAITDKKKLLKKFFCLWNNHLHPPHVFKYPALHNFFQDDDVAKASRALSLSGRQNEVVLVDERNDIRSEDSFPKEWDSAYPPAGEVKQPKAMPLPDLLKLLSASVSRTVGVSYDLILPRRRDSNEMLIDERCT